VKTEILNGIKNRSGRFFNSKTPDIYSGIAVLSAVEHYFYSLRPFALGGQSSKSTGSSFISDGTEGSIFATFANDTDIPAHPEMKLLPGSVTSVLMDSFLQANDHCFGGKLKFNMKRAILKMTHEVLQRDLPDREKALEDILDIARRNNLLEHAQRLRTRLERGAYGSVLGRGINEGDPGLDAAKLGIKDIFGAAELTDAALGAYSMPDRIVEHSYFTMILSVACRLAVSHLKNKAEVF
jgi:hypothetical protein